MASEIKELKELPTIFRNKSGNKVNSVISSNDPANKQYVDGKGISTTYSNSSTTSTLSNNYNTMGNALVSHQSKTGKTIIVANFEINTNNGGAVTAYAKIKIGSTEIDITEATHTFTGASESKSFQIVYYNENASTSAAEVTRIYWKNSDNSTQIDSAERHLAVKDV